MQVETIKLEFREWDVSAVAYLKRQPSDICKLQLNPIPEVK